MPFDEAMEKIDGIIEEYTGAWTYKKGHDYGASYWILPVTVRISDRITDQDVCELSGEISVEQTFFKKYLKPVFVEYFDNTYCPNKYHYTYAFSDEGRYITRFEPCMEYNFYSYEAIEALLKIIEKKTETERLSCWIREMMHNCPETKTIAVVGP